MSRARSPSAGDSLLAQRPMLRFFLVFGLFTVVAFGIEVLPWVDSRVINPMLRGITEAAAISIRLFGGQAESVHNILTHPGSLFAIRVSNGCSGIEAVILLWAGMAAYPTHWRYKMIGFAVGLVAIMVVNLAIGFVTPPIGVNLFVASSLTDIPLMDIARKAMPMIVYFLIALIVITFVPALSLVLLG